MQIWIAHYTHKHGSNISVHATEAHAEDLRISIALDCWDEVMDHPMPEAETPEHLADMYFQAAAATGEFFEIMQDEVVCTQDVACEQLLLAFAKADPARGDGGKVEWDDVSIALEYAKEAMPGRYEAIVAELKAQEGEQ